MREGGAEKRGGGGGEWGWGGGEWLGGGGGGGGEREREFLLEDRGFRSGPIFYIKFLLIDNNVYACM